MLNTPRLLHPVLLPLLSSYSSFPRLFRWAQAFTPRKPKCKFPPNMELPAGVVLVDGVPTLVEEAAMGPLAHTWASGPGARCGWGGGLK